MLKLALFLAMGVSGLAGIAAQTSPSSQVKTAATDGKDPNRMVCRTSEVTGSRLGSRKVCHTALQWEQEEASVRRDVEKIQANRWTAQQ